MPLMSNKEPKDSEQSYPIINKKSRRLKWIVIGITAIVVAAAVVFAIIYFIGANTDQNPTMAQSKFSINYTVTVSDDPNIKVLNVVTRMDIDKLSTERLIYIYKSTILSPILSCEDDKGNKLEINQTSSLLSIGPIDPSAKSVTMVYDVMVGKSQNYTQCYGDFYEDLLVFSGEHVLMSPYLNYDELQKTEMYISSVSFSLVADNSWKAIIPFQEQLSDDFSFTVKKPTWSVFNAINKSSFCFGQFEPRDIGANNAIYVDKAIVDKIPRLSMEIIISFFDYYKQLFGDLSPDAPLVLLRNSTENNAVILGGVGPKGAAISADLNSADDCPTLSSTLYHLFFDSKILAPNLRYPPNSWIYSGLTNYYVLRSSTNLPQEVIDMYSLTVTVEPEINYLNYLYFSIKEPDFLITNPSLEGNMGRAQGAFYMDVKVPVMIDLVNYAIADTVGGNFITALLDAAGKEKDLNVDKFIKSKCGKYYEAILRCFSGDSLLPNYNNYRLDGKVSDEEITSRLTDTDVYFSNLFSHGHGLIEYLRFPLILLNTERFYRDVESMGVRYSTDEIQAEIRNFSTTLDQYLLQYAMFAKLAGYDELTSSAVKQMYTTENFSIWMRYCEDIGFKE